MTYYPWNNQMTTRAQREAMLRLYRRDVPDGMPRDPGYKAMRREFYNSGSFGCMLGKWHDMVLGIEPDGYTHS
jgi:hypothetical protein